MKILTKSEYKRIKKAESDLRQILQSVLTMVKRSRFHYQYNEPGSGDVTYTDGQDTIGFNEFPLYFNGFYINDIGSNLHDVITLLR